MRLERYGEFRVLTLRECAPEAPLGDQAGLVYDYWMAHIASHERHNAEVESMYCLTLSARLRITGYYLVATGLLDTLLAHPREVFRPAIVANAKAIVIMHNHPSGDPSPSEGDIRTTRDLIRAGQLLKIEVLDHVVVGTMGDGRIKPYTSLRELGYFIT